MDPSVQPQIDALKRDIADLSDLLHMHRHLGFDLTQPLFNTAPISAPTLVNAATLGDGTSRSGTLTLSRAVGYGDLYIRAVINASDWANTGAKTGFIFGIDDTTGIAKFYFGSSTAYIKFDGTTLTVAGSLTASKIDIPDTTTANSFHVDSSGNMWVGATTLASALASITKAGLGTFKNISIGGATTQYTVTNNGQFSFGDGNDGAATFDGSTAVAGFSRSGSTYTATRDVYFTNATISTGVTVKMVNYRMFGTGTLTLNGTATIHNNGNAGGHGYDNNNPSTGTGGAAIAAGYFLVVNAGGNGGAGTAINPAPNGSPGIGTSNSLGVNGSNGGVGGQAATGQGTTPGNPGGVPQATAALTRLVANWQLQPMLDVAASGSTAKFDTSASSSGGGTGAQAGSPNAPGGGGGGGGSPGGILSIYFRVIIDNASSIISVNGGAGGHGGDGNTIDSRVGGGGGGGGGSGGVIVLVYNSYTALGTLSANGGAKGTGGAAGGAAGTTAGADGTAGSAGSIYQFNLSL